MLIHSLKKCANCFEYKSLDQFHKQKSTKDGFQCHCKPCKSILQIQYKKSKKNKVINIVEKLCKDCGDNKPIANFNFNILSKDNHEVRCKDCQSIYNKKYRELNQQELSIKKHEYYLENQETIKNNTKIYNENNKEKNRPKKNKYVKDRLKIDKFFRLKTNLRARLRGSLKAKSWKKNTHFSEYIGCDRDILINHLESQFRDGMCWENYGNKAGQWSIDHIIPLDSAKTDTDLYKLCHYKNLQPLWHITENLVKSSKIAS